MCVRFFTIVAVLICAALPGYAVASGQEEAVEAFERGKKLYHAKEYIEAADAFREANRLRPSWKLYYNIGQAEAAGKRYGLALEAFEQYLASGGDEVNEERQHEVRGEIDRLADMVGFLSVEAPDGAVVLVDGIERGRAPLAGNIRVSSGLDHELVIRDETEAFFDRSIRLGSKETMKLHFEPESKDDSEPVTPEPGSVDNAQGSKSRPLGWAFAGVGAATLIAGLAVGGGAMAKKGDLDENCNDTSCTPDQAETLGSAKDLAKVANILIPVGAGVVLAGVIMVLVGGSEEESKEANIAVVPSPFGLSIQGRF